MKLKYLAGCILLIFSARSSAQDAKMPKTVISVRDLYTLEVPTIDMSDARTLDTATLSITYCFSFQIDRNAPQRSAWAILDVGKNFVRFYSHDYFRWDSMYSYNFKHLVPSYSCKHIPCEEVLYRNKSSKITVYNRIPNGPTPLVSYVENTPEIGWQISDSEARIISGHTCHCAKGVYGGREWTVWFAPEIPAPYGPWKLNGLPGLILKAEESKGCYLFECIRISSHPKAMLMYSGKIRNIKKTEWRKLDRKMYSSPLEMMAKDESIWFVYKMRRLDETWTIPYNPIELE